MRVYRRNESHIAKRWRMDTSASGVTLDDRPFDFMDRSCMKDDFDFRSMLGTPTRRRGGNVVPLFRPRRRKKVARSGGLLSLLIPAIIAGIVLGLIIIQIDGAMPAWSLVGQDPAGEVGCVSPEVLDGDTLRCGAQRIRLSSIDAPELPGHCRRGRECTPGDPYASTSNLRSLVAGQAVSCSQVDTDRYGRAVARCSVQGRDLSCAQVSGGFAVQRYGPLIC